MSQGEFAKATGLSQRSISRYEQATRNDEIRRPVLLSWAFATNVPLIWLETGSTSPQPGAKTRQSHRGNGPSTGLAPIIPFPLERAS